MKNLRKNPCGNHVRRGRLTATITHVFTINYVAEMLGEDRERLEAIVSNSDKLTYGSIIRVVHCDDGTITALTDDGIDELRQILADARRSPEAWNDFRDCFVDHEGVIARVKAKSPR
ncbi:hypothetical protein ACWGNA_22375 [Brucella cytisi]|uniref:hypothetical protein n=1 Tax=Brucella cytisi TaxID=407152 RepID=UPI0035DFBC6F